MFQMMSEVLRITHTGTILYDTSKYRLGCMTCVTDEDCFQNNSHTADLLFKCGEWMLLTTQRQDIRVIRVASAAATAVESNQH